MGILYPAKKANVEAIAILYPVKIVNLETVGILYLVKIGNINIIGILNPMKIRNIEAISENIISSQIHNVEAIEIQICCIDINQFVHKTIFHKLQSYKNNWNPISTQNTQYGSNLNPSVKIGNI